MDTHNICLHAEIKKTTALRISLSQRFVKPLSTFNTLLADSAYSILMTFFLFFLFLRKKEFDLSCKLSPNLHECSDYFLGEKNQNVVCGLFYPACKALKVITVKEFNLLSKMLSNGSS